MCFPCETFCSLPAPPTCSSFVDEAQFGTFKSRNWATALLEVSIPQQMHLDSWTFFFFFPVSAELFVRVCSKSVQFPALKKALLLQKDFLSLQEEWLHVPLFQAETMNQVSPSSSAWGKSLLKKGSGVSKIKKIKAISTRLLERNCEFMKFFSLINLNLLDLIRVPQTSKLLHNLVISCLGKGVCCWQTAYIQAVFEN